MKIVGRPEEVADFLSRSTSTETLENIARQLSTEVNELRADAQQHVQQIAVQADHITELEDRAQELNSKTQGECSWCGATAADGVNPNAIQVINAEDTNE